MTTAGDLIREARAQARMTQQALAVASGVPRSSIARIELGITSPRIGTLERLLRACGSANRAAQVGHGIDRTLIRDRLAKTPLERHRLGVQSARALIRFRRSATRPRSLG